MSGPPVCILFILPSTLYTPSRVHLLTADLPLGHFCSVQWDVHLLAKKLFFILNLLKGIFILSSQGNLALIKCTALLHLQFCPRKGAHSAVNLMPLGLGGASPMLPAARCCLPAQGWLQGHVSGVVTQCPCTEIPLLGA